MVAAMLYVLRTGIPWRDLPAHFAPWSSVPPPVCGGIAIVAGFCGLLAQSIMHFLGPEESRRLRFVCRSSRHTNRF